MTDAEFERLLNQPLKNLIKCAQTIYNQTVIDDAVQQIVEFMLDKDLNPLKLLSAIPFVFAEFSARANAVTGVNEDVN